ncbi:MAG: fasciclin domain-containing protein [Gemmataceae bacterium]
MTRRFGPACLLGLALFASAAPPDGPARDLVQTAASSPSFRTLTTALVAAGLDAALKEDGPFTVFAPTDKAFDKLPAGTLEKLLAPEGRDALARILKYHVVPGRLSAAQVAERGTLTTLAGPAVKARHSSHRLLVNDSRVVARDLACRNGVIHVIDAVLTPPADRPAGRAAVEKLGGFKTLLAGLDAAELAGVLEDQVTVFAPTDEAFARLPAGTLTKLLRPENRKALADVIRYHVVPGSVSARDAARAGAAKTALGKSVEVGVGDDGRLKVNDSRVTRADVRAGRLTVHVIDAVLLPH